MFGLYTVNVKVCLPDCRFVIYRKCFLFQRNAEAFAEKVDSIEFGYKVSVPEELKKQDIKGLVTIQDRSQKEYFYKKFPIRFDVRVEE